MFAQGEASLRSFGESWLYRIVKSHEGSFCPWMWGGSLKDWASEQKDGEPLVGCASEHPPIDAAAKQGGGTAGKREPAAKPSSAPT